MLSKVIFVKSPLNPVIFKVYFGSPFYTVFLRYILNKCPFRPVVFEVCFEKGPINPMLLNI